MHAIGRTIRLKTVAVLAATVTAIITEMSLAGWPACERTRITNLVYHCVNPGQQCGDNEKCVEVSGGSIVAWRDCKCKATGAAITAMAGGWWSARALGPLAPETPVPFVLASSGGDRLEIFDADDTDESGQVLESQVFENASDLTGSMTLMILPGPPDAMPVFISELDWQIASFQLADQPTGVNVITLAPGSEGVPGIYNQLAGEIRFDTGIPCTMSNDLFPGGREIVLHPALGVVEGDEYVLAPSWTLTLDDCLGSESFDGYDNNTSLHGLSGWKGWDDDPAFTALTSQSQARTGAQSLRIDGASDLVHEICTPSSGTYSLTAWQYIPSDFSTPGMGPNQGTWIVLLDSYQDGGPYHWAVQMQFNPNTGLVKVFDGDGNIAGSAPYSSDRWVKVRSIIDLDEDWTRVYYDDNLISEYPWTGGVLGESSGNLDVAAVDFFANDSSSVFYDDILIEKIDEDVPCPADLVNSQTFQPPADGQVDAADLAFLLGEWGASPGSPADLVTSATFQPPPDGVVDAADLAVLLGEWGSCD